MHQKPAAAAPAAQTAVKAGPASVAAPPEIVSPKRTFGACPAALLALRTADRKLFEAIMHQDVMTDKDGKDVVMFMTWDAPRYSVYRLPAEERGAPPTRCATKWTRAAAFRALDQYCADSGLTPST
jgi:hypothetical protein